MTSPFQEAWFNPLLFVSPIIVAALSIAVGQYPQRPRELEQAEIYIYIYIHTYIYIYIYILYLYIVIDTYTVNKAVAIYICISPIAM